MITDIRQQKIMELLNSSGHVKVSELVEKLKASEATIRRDLAHLEDMNLLRRVHGGAMSNANTLTEKSYQEKDLENKPEKEAIAKHAASLIQDGDSVFLDAGTTTGFMIPHLKNKKILVVTNGFHHVEALASLEIPTMILGGRVKPKTKAIIGQDAIKNLARFRFDACFMGANGIHPVHGLTTPDVEEADIKEKAIVLSKSAYVLVDGSKFNQVSFRKFAEVGDITIITNQNQSLAQYRNQTKVVEVT